MSARPAIFETLDASHVAASQTAVLLLHGLCSTPDELLELKGRAAKLFSAAPVTAEPAPAAKKAPRKPRA